jgi:hypothetical protein
MPEHGYDGFHNTGRTTGERDFLYLRLINLLESSKWLENIYGMESMYISERWFWRYTVCRCEILIYPLQVAKC